MSQADFWYIRFPDGRVLRAASTTVIRQELSARRIPLASTVRRTPNDEWVSISWMQEFADLVEELQSQPPPEPPATRSASAPPAKPLVEPRRPVNAAANEPATVGSRVDPARLQLVGVRGYLGELLAALDSTLVLKKLLLGAIAGLFLGALLMLLERAAWFEPESGWLAAAWPMLLLCLLVFDAIASLLTRLTFIELSRLRPARWREALEGLVSLTFRVVVVQAVAGGIVWGLIVLLRWLPFWLSPGAEDAWSKAQQILAGSALSLGMLVEAMLWPVFVFLCQMPPLLVVEDCSVWSGLRQWSAFLNRHLGRVFLYQTMAVGLGVLVTAPFLLLSTPLFLPSFYPPAGLQEAATGTRYLLLGLAFAPMLTYWITSNVFIYLNLHYGASSRR